MKPSTLTKPLITHLSPLQMFDVKQLVDKLFDDLPPPAVTNPYSCTTKHVCYYPNALVIELCRKRGYHNWSVQRAAMAVLGWKRQTFKNISGTSAKYYTRPGKAPLPQVDWTEIRNVYPRPRGAKS